MEDQKLWPGLALNQNFAKKEGPKAKVKSENVKIEERDGQTSVLTQTYHRWGSGGKAPSRWAIFCIYLEKIVTQF